MRIVLVHKWIKKVTILCTYRDLTVDFSFTYLLHQNIPGELLLDLFRLRFEIFSNPPVHCHC